ncbi:hypothetical protein Tsubulata_047318 [Turnera subulata]|uniref:DNA-directed RNA polymerase III subunit RPC6 n=1 Tax=Turnera subulata TaxID=218843 RepID=A0A9Q0G1G0_9ROSI|nr:hypothetical protein Tsubulata_047318 [Turnera subulata]
MVFTFHIPATRMNRSLGPPGPKRKRPESSSQSDSLTEQERILYEVIRSKQDMGIWTRDMKRETNLQDSVVNKSLKVLVAKNLIKEVVNIKNKGKKFYMAAEFQPSKEITGGAWYAEGQLDTALISFLKDFSAKQIQKQRVLTLDVISDLIRRSGVLKVDLAEQQIKDILRALVLDDEIIEVLSTGTGEFASFPVGKVCYKCTSKGARGGEPKTGAFSSVPCGVCPRILLCTPEGVISPKTCVYYNKWLEF